MYAAANSSGGTAVATIQIPGNTTVREVILQGTVAGAGGKQICLELSESSTAQFATNNALGIIATLNGASDLTVGTAAIAVSHPNVKLQAGQTIYLHALLSSSDNWTGKVTLIID